MANTLRFHVKYEGLNGVPLKSLIIKFGPKNRLSVKSMPKNS